MFACLKQLKLEIVQDANGPGGILLVAAVETLQTVSFINNY